MSEKNESYLFDLLESMNESLKGIKRLLMFTPIALFVMSLVLFFLVIA